MTGLGHALVPTHKPLYRQPICEEAVSFRYATAEAIGSSPAHTGTNGKAFIYA